ncbi:MAG: hypothetical protein OXG80_09220 [Chloroflexi bacterium]|nr:hypothetical protein [Chloroflexota bacterium]
MATPPETEQRQYTDRDLGLRDLGLIESRQEQGLKRLEDLIETVRELDRKTNRHFLTLLSIIIDGFVALLSITIGGFIMLANMIARLSAV